MPRNNHRRPAGGGSAAATALKGRAANAPSCYVNVGSNGTSMTSTNYVVPPPGTLPAGSTVETLAQGSTYFKDVLANTTVEEGPEDNLFANFLSIRGPSFGPNYASGNQQGKNNSLTTPSMTRTIDKKIYKRVKKESRDPTNRRKKMDQDVEEEDSEVYSDEEDEYSEDDEDEPFVGGGNSHHPASSYSTHNNNDIVAEAKTEQEKQMLLAQAFAYVEKVERDNIRMENLEARRARRGDNGNGGGKNIKTGKTGKSGRDSGSGSSSSSSSNRQRKKKISRRPQQNRGGGVKSRQKGRQQGRQQAQSRLYGKKMLTTNRNSNTIEQQQQPATEESLESPNTFFEVAAEDPTPDTTNMIEMQLQKALKRHVQKKTSAVPSAPAVLQNTYVNMKKKVKKSTKNPPTGAKKFTTNNKKGSENNENAVNASDSIAEQFLSFQPPSSVSDHLLRTNSNEVRPTGFNDGRGGNHSNHSKRPSARERRPQASIIPEVPKDSNQKRKKGALTDIEIKELLNSLESGNNARHLKKELETSQKKMNASEMAFKKAQEEFAMLL